MVIAGLCYDPIAPVLGRYPATSATIRDDFTVDNCLFRMKPVKEL